MILLDIRNLENAKTYLFTTSIFKTGEPYVRISILFELSLKHL